MSLPVFPVTPDAFADWIRLAVTGEDVAYTDARLLLDKPAVPAAVLIACVVDGSDVRLMFTQRAEHLNHHGGQISFPGGRLEPGEHAEAAAIREAHEEIGLDPAFVHAIATMPDYYTVSGYRVTPVIACVRPGYSLRAADDEVAHIFDVPLGFVLNEENWHIRYAEALGRNWPTPAITWQGHRTIWGATAGMLAGLRTLLRKSAT
ncbi:CoA pyrophosphatase [Burkholderiaceae bacterium DAT-1]|nr:CoA pyrophosphatase [Burkholderiaceae bacterium DAT-1]